MTLAQGARLGPYEVLGPLGAGGMGEVYRARDSRLGRIVALKVLPVEATFDDALRLRLEREAQVISSLNHPNICSLYDIGKAGGFDYLVMEYLEGEALARRIDQGPLQLRQALEIGIQVADALAYSHKHNVVHRDLKPDNVMLTRSGAKLLDFGLAKLSRTSSDEWPKAGERRSLTQDGLVVGTVDYMSPEQLSGKDADPRSDIFGFGCVLYEMVSGKRAFDGANQASVIGAILHVTPAKLMSVRQVPEALDRIVGKCLEKDPDDRWQSARDLADELRWVLGTLPGSSATGVPPGAVPPPAKTTVTPVQKPARRRRVSRVAVLALAAGAALGFLLPRAFSPPRPARVTRLSLPMPTDEPLAAGFGPSLALSPDGRLLAYLGTLDGVRYLYLRPLDSERATRLSGTETAEGPFFSPDGRWIGFFARQRLMKVAVEGGPPIELATAEQAAGGCWLKDDTIIFSPRFSAALVRVPAKGGKVSPVTELDPGRGERTHRWPSILPSGEDLVFIAGDASISSFDEARLELYSMKTKKRWTLLQGASDVRVLPSKDTRLVPIVFVRGGTLLATELDVTAGKLTSAGVPVTEGVRVNPSGAASFAFSLAGDLVYAPGETGEADRRLVWIDRFGRLSPVSEHRRAYQLPQLSPDGRTVAVVIRTATYDVWLLDLSRGTLSRLTFSKVNSSRPAFSADGKELFVGAWGPGEAASLYRIPADLSQAPAKMIRQDTNDLRQTSASPDGRLLVVNEFSPETMGDIAMLPLREGAGGELEVIAKTPAGERDAVVSPDGRWLAYVSNESGREEIYVRPFPGPGGRFLVSRDGGRWPVWARSTKAPLELFFRAENGILSVKVTTEPSLSTSEPELLFDRPTVDTRFDVDAEGKRFLMVEPGAKELAPADLRVVLGWLDDVRERMKPGEP